jgi:hypothetical protein
MTDTKKTITLYLAGWQKRMIKDYMGGHKIEVNKVRVINIPTKEWVMYRVVTFEHAQAGTWNLHLTDEQITHVMETMNLKAPISALNVSPAMLKSGAIAFE